MNKKEENNDNLKKPEPFAYKNWTELIKPTKIDVDKKETKTFGSVSIEPLERGFGLTIGNALRRILLSSLQGAAVTSIQIDGVLHEFSSIPGMIEDVTDFILNIKSLAIKLNSDQPKKMSLKASGPGEIKASEIETGSEIEIINPDLTLCHLDKSAKINLELTVQNGKGYVAAELHKKEDKQIGLILVDSIFSPVKKVSYNIENSRVGQVTDYDKLILNVETNGSMEPDDAIAMAARILQEQF